LLNVPRGSQVQTAAQTRNFTNNSNMPINITINGNADDRTVHTIRNTLETFAKNFADASRNGYIKRGQFA